MGRRSSGRTRRTVAVVTLAAGVAAAAWEAVRRRGGAPADRGEADARSGPATRSWTCECGQRIRSTGAGRHRVHWLADAPENDPILGDRCPSCDRPLPAEDAAVPARA
jgi:hypothetical protein